MMIGARTAAWAKSGSPTAKDYVQDGLIAMWDGIENAGWGVHDPNATTWKDLSGNGEDITLRSGAYWSQDSLCQDTVHGSFGAWKRALDGYRHAEGVFRNDSPPDGSTRVCLISFHNYDPYDFQVGIFNGGVRFGYYTGNSPIIGIQTAYDRIAFSFAVGDDESRPKTISAYKDGKETVSVGVCFSGASGTGLGGGRGNNRAMSGRVWCLRFYSRNLTAEEVAANYAIDKARFNLPDAA